MASTLRLLRAWLHRLCSGDPHFVIGGPRQPYMLRWYLLPRNPVCNVYLHKFLRDDDDRALHDHPWASVSILLRGRLREITQWGYRYLRPGRVVLRSARFRHRLELITPAAWTLFITGPRVRDWGFWCPQGFVGWQDFTAPTDSGQIGRGCDAAARIAPGSATPEPSDRSFLTEKPGIGAIAPGRLVAQLGGWRRMVRGLLGAGGAKRAAQVPRPQHRHA